VCLSELEVGKDQKIRRLPECSLLDVVALVSPLPSYRLHGVSKSTRAVLCAVLSSPFLTNRTQNPNAPLAWSIKTVERQHNVLFALVSFFTNLTKNYLLRKS
jgi:hypothetical protein